ncbi:UDP-N-acetylglucosamine 4,6-dehydratase (EC [Olavius sp. associated proteobacterium Delta 1]|nr:UDP-N-acetylglucosamine 4,6-dehydratase (EC [Olavius sp. associated proteobacterium Delta 1]
MTFGHRYRNFYVILGVDLFFLIGSLYCAHLVRFEFKIPPEHYMGFYRILPFVLFTKIMCFFFFDLYRGMWRYTGIADLMNIIKASSISTLILICFILLRYRFLGFSRSVFLIDWCLTILFIAGFRVCVRLYYERADTDQVGQSISQFFSGLFKRNNIGTKNLLIIGAGDAGEKICREISVNAALQYRVVGFLDDNPLKLGRKIHGIPVLGYISDIEAISNKVKANAVLIAVPSANSRQMRKMVELCNKSSLDYKTIPGMGELINGKVTVNAIREVDYRDLLGREIIKLEEDKIGAYLNGQTVMVTGAGGSIGSELCRQISRFKPEKIIMFERAESPLHAIALELKNGFKDAKVVPVLADIQDMNQLEKAFTANLPQIVFHAAAYKHVPMLELQPWKAIDNNVLGTKNLIDISSKYSVAKFVFVSTDKAVRPANVMGASKRLSEMLVQSQNGCGLSQTRFMIVRFGNVVGSVGSVVPLFKKQIQSGGPVTVTHPEVTRFFMTIPEACQLILQTGAMGNGGEIFILDMGTPIKIADMARDLIRLSGFEPDDDIKIEYIGLRPGEKLYEELITEGENIVPTRHEKIMVLKGIECELKRLNGEIDQLAHLAKEQQAEKIISKIMEILQEYRQASH